MVDRINSTTTQIPFSPLRNSSIGYIDDYESGMEASASSMAEEDEIDLEEEDITHQRQPQHTHQHTKKRTTILDYKATGGRNGSKSYTSHRRMSSGNSSTDSNATIPPPPTSAATTHAQSTKRHVIPKGEFTSPLNIQTPASVRLLARKEDVPTPSSGYDGDTEGPLVEDNI